jgi:methionine synthase I (cobalamin-dependent)
VHDRASDTDLLDALSKGRDGAAGTGSQVADLAFDACNDLEDCSEIINKTRPDGIGTECVRLQSG